MDGSLTRRSLGRITAVLVLGGSVLLGWLLGAFDVDVGEEDSADGETVDTSGDPIPLPPPGSVEGDKRVAAAIADRRSRREYGPDPITAAELGELLFAAQGITRRRRGSVDFRAAPSAGATYPLELFVVVGDPGVEGFDAGVYHYDVDEHTLAPISSGDVQPDLERIALDQAPVGDAALDIVVTGVDERTTQRYGRRGRLRYVPMEAGHAGENVYLQAESLGLSTVGIGAFGDEELRDLLEAPDSHRPLYVFPVGDRV